MDGSRVSFFELAALPAIGETLLDPRPAFAFSADGGRCLFANAAAVAALDATDLDDLLSRRFTDLNPIKAQMARMSRILPTEQSRLEVLRFGGGVSSITLTAACRRLNLAEDERVVLAVAAGGSSTDSLRTRAERLASALAGHQAQVAILDDDGEIVAAAAPDSAPLDAADLRELAIAAEDARGRPISERERRHGETIHARAVRFSAEGRDLTLIVVERAEDAVVAPQNPPSGPASHPSAAAVPAPSPAVPAPPPAPIIAAAALDPPVSPAPVRFAFEIDRDGRFQSVTEELGALVGSENGALSGHFWADIADRFGEAGDPITRALATGTGFSTKLAWPATDGVPRAVELTAIHHPLTRGFRGFGLIGGAATTAPPVASLALDVAPVPMPVAPAEPPLTAPVAAPPTPESAPPTSAKVEDAPPQSDDRADPRSEPGDTPPHASETPAAEATAVTISEVTPEPEAEPDAPPALPSNIVRLPGAPSSRTLPAPLSGVERDAFRRIAEALGTREPASTTEPAGTPAPAVEPVRPTAIAETIDAKVIDRLPLGIVIFRDGHTLLVNRTLVDLLGYASADAFMEAGGAEAVFPNSDDIAGRVSAADGNVLALRADGSTIQVKAWLHAVPFAGSTALLLAVDSIERDGSLASALADSESRVAELEAILDTATDGVIVFDRRGRMQSMNHAAEALFGIDASQYFDRYFTDLLAEESQKGALDYLDGLIANGVASVLNDGREVIGRTPSGGLIPLFMTMGRIGSSDKFCAVLRDITHWKNVEEELVAARRAAETANTQKSNFLAKISHEIRTPLNAIIGFSEVMASERFGPIGNERYRQYLRDIHVSGGHLMSLINDLLDLSKIEAGNADLAFEAVAINAAIQECVALMQPQANRERIIIRTALAADVPNIVADPRSLRQILLNLLSNAVKFTRAGGQVIVSSALEANGEVVVRIRDTGIGMSEKDIETALKPFRQVAIAREDRDQGTGLGLPLTKALVEANRATFDIDSAPNQGTLVKITFPTTRVLAG